MRMHWLRYDIGIIGKVGRNTFLVTVKVNYLDYVETTAPKYRVFCVLTRQTYSVTTFATDKQMLPLVLNYFRTVSLTIETPLLNCC
jgi:hypothetical protein